LSLLRTKNGSFLLCFVAIVLLIGPVAASVPSSNTPNHSTITLNSPNAQSDGQFGYSIAAGSGIVVVGAPTETANSAADGGHAYIFNEKTGALLFTLASPNAQEDAQFGISVGVGKDFVVVGAPYETAEGDQYAGHAYTFSIKTGDLISTLTSPNAQQSGYFGYSVAASGKTVVVGAYNEEVGGVRSGSAYTFNGDSGALLATLASPGAIAGGLFGTSVAMSGKIAVVGAPAETSGGVSGAGNAYAFNSANGGVISTFVNPNAEFDSEFGSAVAISKNVVVVGAYGTGDYEGIAFMFDTTTGSLINTLSSSNPQTFGYFGYSVGVGTKLAVVGAHGETAGGQTEAGNAYTFNGATGATMKTLSAPTPQGGASFGFSVATSGSVVVAGASGESVGSLTDCGQAYIF
jgi:FG-GAP repeat